MPGPQFTDSLTNPDNGQALYSAKASYAMGRDDDTDTNGIGPKQEGRASTGFMHGDNMDCASCHSSWSNSCVGCHLKGDYDEGNNFSNITGERIVFRRGDANGDSQLDISDAVIERLNAAYSGPIEVK